MANNYTVVGDGNITFGTGEVAGSTIGEVLSASRKSTGEKLELKNSKGNTYAVVYFDDREEIQIEAILDADYESPVRGDLIDLAGLTDLIVEDVELKWGNKEEKKISITCTKYAAVVIS